MSRSARSFIGPILFLVGCATGGLSSRYVETAAAAPSEGTPRWSYRCFKNDTVSEIQERADDLGQQGWELASSALSGGADMSSPIWCFKRPR